MIRVLHSEFDNRIGGIEMFLYNVLSCIDDNDISFEFLTRRNNPVLVDEIISLGGKFRYVSSKPLQYIKQIKSLLKTEHYDVIHVHKNSAADIILPIIAKLHTKSKIIIHSHNTQPQKAGRTATILHYINKPLLNKIADKKLACSDLAAKWLFMNDDNVEIINNGIITEKYKFNKELRDEVRKRLGIEDKYVIGNAARFTEQKNHKFLIDIMSALDDSYKLLLVGDGPLREKVEEYARSKNVYNKIIFLGQRKDVNELMQAMDLFAMPSLYEGLPVACVEAQASGLPVMLSDNSSKMCAITENVIFLSIKDVITWVNKIEYIRNTYKRHDTEKQISKAGFDMKTNAKKLSAIYKGLVI